MYQSRRYFPISSLRRVSWGAKGAPKKGKGKKEEKRKKKKKEEKKMGGGKKKWKMTSLPRGRGEGELAKLEAVAPTRKEVKLAPLSFGAVKKT